MTDITIPAADSAAAKGAFSGYLATPRTGKGPGILLIQEIFGVNIGMREIADGYAAQGYTVLCPDLFWRQEPGVQLTDKTEVEWKRAFQLMQGFDQEKGVGDLIASLAFLRGHSASTGKAGTLGYCLGGRLAFLMAVRCSADCNVGYYGVGLEKLVGDTNRITRPLLLHIAENDEFCPPKDQAAIKAGLAGNPLVQIHSYPGMNHGFARPNGTHYNKETAELADRRTLEFFRRHLGP